MTKMNNQNEEEFTNFEPTQNMRICFVNADEDDEVAEDESSAGTSASTMRFTVRSGGLMFYKIRKNYKVESKGRTTYNEVADELVAELALPNDEKTSLDQIDRVYMNTLTKIALIDHERKRTNRK